MKISRVQASLFVEVHFPGEITLKGPRGATAKAFIDRCGIVFKAPVVGAIINGELHELTSEIVSESIVTPILMTDADGARIYRRSLSFLLSAAFKKLFPDAILHIDHSVYPVGYYCHVSGHAPLEKADLAALAKEMRTLVKSDLPFEKKEISLTDALCYFTDHGEMDKVDLLKYRTKNHVTFYNLGDYLDYHHGFMVPSTGYLKWFDILQTNGGFTLRYPKRSTPTKINYVDQYPTLLKAFRLYGDWLNTLGIENVGALNNAIQNMQIKELILVSEAFHEQHITNIARQIFEHKGENRIILISGPTSSGKTTFSRKLAIQLLSLGISPFPLELDNYFVNREDTPKDENGEVDFETLQAIDLPKLSNHLYQLIEGKTVRIPHYNFVTGQQEPGNEVTLKNGQMIILEGIHGLNPGLIPMDLYNRSYKIYISALTQLNLDYHNRVSTTDTRLLRRIIRDSKQRGYNAQQTISMWESVRRGEEKHIFPHQENADVMFNSALVYELAVLKPIVEPILRQVPNNTPEYIEAKRLLAFLEWFLPVEPDLVPDNSILREFIGGSILKDFIGWNG
jgi:uridine kinase